MTKPTIGKVFVPGGMPELTYVPRTERHLETSLAEVRDNLCKLVVVTGATKTGKTVLVKKVLEDQTSVVWLDGGLIETMDGFLSDCLHELGLDLISERETSEGSSSARKTSGKIGGKLFGIGAEASGERGQGKTNNKKMKVIPAGTKQTILLDALAESESILVIDDFHYVARDLQGAIVRALKGRIFRGLPVVLIAIPHRRYDAVRVEREMNGRIQGINVPDWSIDELVEIATTGFPLLDLHISAIMHFATPRFCDTLRGFDQRSEA